MAEDVRGNFMQGNMSAVKSSSAGLYPHHLDNIDSVPFFYHVCCVHVAGCLFGIPNFLVWQAYFMKH